MTEQIIATIFIIWFFVGIALISIGSFINSCTDYMTDIDEIGWWLLGLLLGADLIIIFVGLIILVWR